MAPSQLLITGVLTTYPKKVPTILPTGKLSLASRLPRRFQSFADHADRHLPLHQRRRPLPAWPIAPRSHRWRRAARLPRPNTIVDQHVVVLRLSVRVGDDAIEDVEHRLRSSPSVRFPLRFRARPRRAASRPAPAFHPESTTPPCAEDWRGAPAPRVHSAPPPLPRPQSDVPGTRALRSLSRS